MIAMMLQTGRRALFSTMALLSAMALSALAAAGQTQPLDDTFHFVLWNQPGGMIEETTTPSTMVKTLRDQWFNALIPQKLPSQLEIHIPAANSIQEYINAVNANNPVCIEGEIHFIEKLWNTPGNKKYCPILRYSPPKDGAAWGGGAPSGEILFFENKTDWRGTIGIVHENYSSGGQAQIQRWIEKTGHAPQWISFANSRELLNHFFVGTIDAAAVPTGELERFIAGHQRGDLLAHLQRIPIQRDDMDIAIFLRHDWHDAIFLRTWTAETWLRETFPARLFSVPKFWAYTVVSQSSK